MLIKNLAEIKKRIISAAARVNRSPADIKLVAVSKRVPVERILDAIAIGHLIFGENYVQEALEKIPYIKKATNEKPLFHFIGKLQSNKAKKAVEIFDVIETVDSIKLGLALDRQCATLGKTVEAYIQVNIGAEKQKSGVDPEECEKLLQSLSHCQFMRITGLMIMPPYSPDPEKSRPYFQQLRRLSEKLSKKGLLGIHGPVELSMGMSADFEVAVEEGATTVRIGTALFGARSH